MYFSGDILPQDYKQAKRWSKLAAEQGDSGAQLLLGIMYYEGKGTVQDFKESARFIKLASEQGDSEAQMVLGSLYADGVGVPEDLIYAHMGSNIAGSNGQSKGIENRDAVANKMTKKQVIKAQKLAKECVAKKYKSC